MHPSVEHILQFFKHKHLPKHLREISEPFCTLAIQMVNELVVIEEISNPEITAGLRKLLEAKDCFVRARLAKE